MKNPIPTAVPVNEITVENARATVTFDDIQKNLHKLLWGYYRSHTSKRILTAAKKKEALDLLEKNLKDALGPFMPASPTVISHLASTGAEITAADAEITDADAEITDADAEITAADAEIIVNSGGVAQLKSESAPKGNILNETILIIDDMKEQVAKNAKGIDDYISYERFETFSDIAFLRILAHLNNDEDTAIESLYTFFDKIYQKNSFKPENIKELIDISYEIVKKLNDGSISKGTDQPEVVRHQREITNNLLKKLLNRLSSVSDANSIDSEIAMQDRTYRVFDAVIKDQTKVGDEDITLDDLLLRNANGETPYMVATRLKKKNACNVIYNLIKNASVTERPKANKALWAKNYDGLTVQNVQTASPDHDISKEIANLFSSITAPTVLNTPSEKEEKEDLKSKILDAETSELKPLISEAYTRGMQSILKDDTVAAKLATVSDEDGYLANLRKKLSLKENDSASNIDLTKTMNIFTKVRYWKQKHKATLFMKPKVDQYQGKIDTAISSYKNLTEISGKIKSIFDSEKDPKDLITKLTILQSYYILRDNQKDNAIVDILQKFLDRPKGGLLKNKYFNDVISVMYFLLDKQKIEDIFQANYKIITGLDALPVSGGRNMSFAEFNKQEDKIIVQDGNLRKDTKLKVSFEFLEGANKQDVKDFVIPTHETSIKVSTANEENIENEKVSPKEDALAEFKRLAENKQFDEAINIIDRFKGDIADATAVFLNKDLIVDSEELSFAEAYLRGTMDKKNITNVTRFMEANGLEKSFEYQGLNYYQSALVFSIYNGEALNKDTYNFIYKKLSNEDKKALSDLDNSGDNVFIDLFKTAYGTLSEQGKSIIDSYNAIAPAMPAPPPPPPRQTEVMSLITAFKNHNPGIGISDTNFCEKLLETLNKSEIKDLAEGDIQSIKNSLGIDVVSFDDLKDKLSQEILPKDAPPPRPAKEVKSVIQENVESSNQESSKKEDEVELAKQIQSLLVENKLELKPGTEIGKYLTMKKNQLPDEAVLQKMTLDNVVQPIVGSKKESATPPPPKSSSQESSVEEAKVKLPEEIQALLVDDNLELKHGAKIDKYLKMKQAGIPDGAVVLKMKAEGVVQPIEDSKKQSAPHTTKISSNSSTLFSKESVKKELPKTDVGSKASLLSAIKDGVQLRKSSGGGSSTTNAPPVGKRYSLSEIANEIDNIGELTTEKAQEFRKAINSIDLDPEKIPDHVQKKALLKRCEEAINGKVEIDEKVASTKAPSTVVGIFGNLDTNKMFNMALEKRREKIWPGSDSEDDNKSDWSQESENDVHSKNHKK